MSIIKELTVMDENGNVQSKHRWKSKPNPEGFVLVYRDAMKDLAIEAPSLSVMKVFNLLGSMQPFEGGIAISKQAIADRIGTTYKSVWSACKWLIENGYIGEQKINGMRQFILNPNVTTCGKKRQAKEIQWSLANDGKVI